NLLQSKDSGEYGLTVGHRTTGRPCPFPATIGDTVASATASETVPPARRRVAVLGGTRIPFARSDGAYAEASNQDMFTAVLDGLADRFDLAGERLDAVVGGAVLKHSRDFNLMRESVLGSA